MSKKGFPASTITTAFPLGSALLYRIAEKATEKRKNLPKVDGRKSRRTLTMEEAEQLRQDFWHRGSERAKDFAKRKNIAWSMLYRIVNMEHYI